MGEMPANRTLSVIAARCQLPRGGGSFLAKPYTSQLNRKLQSQPYRKASPGRGKLSRNAVTRLMRAHRQLLLTRTPHPALRATCSPFCRYATFSPGAGEICPQGVKALAATGKLPGKEQNLQARQRLPLRGRLPPAGGRCHRR